MIDVLNITLAVLAGGAGTRMGTPKANLCLAGRPILLRLLERIRWPGPTLLVTSPAVEDPPGCEAFDDQAVDPVSGMGPLRGVLTALEHSRTLMTCVVTVDMPNVRPTLLLFLAGRLSLSPAAMGIMCRGIPGALQPIEPFPSVYRSAASAIIDRQLKTHRRSVHRLCEDPAFITVDPPADLPADTWTNLNYPADLAAYDALEKERG